MLLGAKPITTIGNSDPVPSETVTWVLWCQRHQLLMLLSQHWPYTSQLERLSPTLVEFLWSQFSSLVKKKQGPGM